uniref:hypothetical protein n=1 Tax=Vibrio alfacsensis TaxID=1074311 RepID=UPI001F49D53E|nr:hypothetical protein [Vibrio alfacsensis]
MKINKCSAAIIGCLLLSSTAQAVEVSTPEFYGSVRAQAAFQEGNDYTTDIYQAEAGLVGFVPVYDFNLRYQLEAEYSESMPKLNAKGEKADDNDLIVREANIIMMNKNGERLLVQVQPVLGLTFTAKSTFLKATTWNAIVTTSYLAANATRPISLH